MVTKDELASAAGKTVPDIIAPNLKILFCGINPGLYSGAVGHHFARPGNRFWPTLYAAGFTCRLLAPNEGYFLLEKGYGITNIVERASLGESDLTREELIEGGKRLVEKIKIYRPFTVAFLGIGAFRKAFNTPLAKVGPQEEDLAGAKVWIVPNPSGLNANYTPKALSAIFEKLRLSS
jgi:TDG/mug DNA glycosylase family protein